MCWEIDYPHFAAQKQEQEARKKKEQRAGVIDQLLNQGGTQGPAADQPLPQAKEVAPAK